MKKTGKVLSLVLSLALVASSLTATFASAAPSSESGTVDAKTLYVVNGGATTAQLTSPDIVAELPTEATLSDKTTTTSLDLKDIVVVSGGNLATVKNVRNASTGNIDSSTLVLANKNVQGDVVLATRYEGAVTRTGNTDASKVYAQGKVTVKVLKAGTTVIVKGASTGNDATPNGFTTYPEALDSLAKTSADVIYGMVETVGLADTPTDATPTWKLCSIAVTTPAASKYCVTTNGVAVDLAALETDKAFSITSKADSNKYSSVGSIAVHAQNYGADTKPLNGVADKANATTYVTNTVKASATLNTISSYQGGTYLAAAAVTAAPKTTELGDTILNVSGSDVDFTNVTGDVTVSGGSVGKITGVPATQKITVEDGTIGSIDVASDVVVNKGSIGDITSKKTVTVNNGKTGNITTKEEAAGAITVLASGENTKATVGDLKTKALSVSATNSATVKTGNITTVDGGTVELGGENVTVGTIDNDYNSATLTFNGFTGTVAAPVNGFALGGGASKYLSVVANNSSNVTVTGTPYIYGLTINDVDSAVTFAGNVKIGANGVSGSGTLAFAPNALYSEGSVSGISIKLTKPFKVGDVAFTAVNDAAYVGAFNPYGFTVEKTVGTNVDTFKVASVTFAGINIVGSNMIEEGTTETYTAVTYPDATKLPEGETVKWTFDGNTNYLVATADEKDSSKITVKAVKKDDTFESLNKGTLTAKVYDAYGYEDYNYKAATFNVAIGKKPSAYTSDTTGTYNMLIGQTYQFKITSSDGSVPPFVVANGGATVAPYTKSGNNEYFFKVTGAKAGDYGVYVGDKVCVLHITDVKTDTTKVTIKDGASYVFKITKGEKAPAPKFVVAGQGTVLPVDVRGNDYFYKVTNNGRTGDVGVYVNGPKIAVITFTK